MAITIGRIGTDGITVPEPSSVAWSGDEVTLGGFLHGMSEAAAVHAAGQFAGLAGNPDEQVVPLTSSESPHLDGFYRVMSAGTQIGAGHQDIPWVEWSVQLRRVGDWQSPTLESYVVFGGPMTNSHSYTSSAAFLYLPSVVHYASAPDINNWDRAVGTGRTLSDGSLLEADGILGGAAASTVYSGVVSWAIDADKFYRGAVTVEQDIGSSTWRKVVGRQLRQDQSWRISNGLTRLSITSAGIWTLECWDGSAWDSITFLIGKDVFITVAVAFVRLIRNGPERATVRLQLAMPAQAIVPDPSVWVDVSLSRGHRGVSCHMVATRSTVTLAIGVENSTAGDSITGGVRASSDNADGNRYILLSDDGLSVNTTDGRLSSSWTDSRFWVGMHVSPGGDVSNHDGAARQDFYGQLSESLRVVSA